ncbi:hypothetical protein CYMTET_47730 [Cymbomonas tetramitiformis]|uniref:Uncharacterized protein n=1 Tax=Cymbomonas tetramitiformis TaxID=36881 RepID=A0AAE0EVU3_9CHLO|nr:hypothetical protein CYMTET_47730 [Cymbomonas tetramitiformis]
MDGTNDNRSSLGNNCSTRTIPATTSGVGTSNTPAHLEAGTITAAITKKIRVTLCEIYGHEHDRIFSSFLNKLKARKNKRKSPQPWEPEDVVVAMVLLRDTNNKHFRIWKILWSILDEEQKDRIVIDCLSYAKKKENGLLALYWTLVQRWEGGGDRRHRRAQAILSYHTRSEDQTSDAHVLLYLDRYGKEKFVNDVVNTNFVI